MDNHDKAIEVLLELTGDQESGKDVLVSCWEMLVDLLLYRLERKPSIKDMEQVNITLTVLFMNSNLHEFLQVMKSGDGTLHYDKNYQ